MGSTIGQYLITIAKVNQHSTKNVHYWNKQKFWLVALISFAKQIGLQNNIYLRIVLYMINSAANRALPMLNYKHAISMIKLFNQCQPETEFIQLNFQYNQNQRMPHANFFSRQNYESGKNILLNRLAHINNKIEKLWLDQSLNTFKIKCKQLFLQPN